MTFQSDLNTGIDEVYALAAIAATYTDRDSATTAVTALVEYDLQQWGNVAEIAGKTAVVSVRVSEMAYPPRRGETYTIDGTVYVVDSILRADELEHAALVA